MSINGKKKKKKKKKIEYGGLMTWTEHTPGFLETTGSKQHCNQRVLIEEMEWHTTKCVS